jgi:hypothetical protein
LVDNWTKIRVRLHETVQRSFAILGVADAVQGFRENYMTGNEDVRSCYAVTTYPKSLNMFFVSEFILLPKRAFSGAFAKLRKATVSFVTSAHPSVSVEQLGSYGADFNEI